MLVYLLAGFCSLNAPFTVTKSQFVYPLVGPYCILLLSRGTEDAAFASHGLEVPRQVAKVVETREPKLVELIQQVPLRQLLRQAPNHHGGILGILGRAQAEVRWPKVSTLNATPYATKICRGASSYHVQTTITSNLKTS